MESKTWLNIAIVFAIATLAYFVPGGRAASEVVNSALSVAFLALLAWFVARLYRQRRVEILSLLPAQRGAIYLGVGAFLLLVTAL